MKRVSVLVGLVALVAAACGDAPSGSDGIFRLVSIDGDVRIRHSGEWSPAEEDLELVRGDEVSVGRHGGATIALPGGARIELGDGTRLGLASPREPRLFKGSLLADAKTPLRLSAKGFDVEAERGSIVRVDLLLGHRVGVYDGEVTVPGSGWGSAVAALTQLDIVGGTATAGPTPLRIRPDDPWDLRILGEAIDVGAALDQKETGLRAQLEGEAAEIALSRVLGTSVPKAELDALLVEFAPEAIVVAAIIAKEIGGEPTADVLREILALRMGAGWELVAGRWEVASSVLQQIGVLAGEVLEQVREEAAERREREEARRAARARSRGGAGSASSSGGDGGDGGGGGNPPKKKPQPVDPGPGESECETIECTVGGVVPQNPLDL